MDHVYEMLWTDLIKYLTLREDFKKFSVCYHICENLFKKCII